MQRRLIWTGGAILAVGLIATGQLAHALITRLTPLRDVLKENQFICSARVEKVDPSRPGAVFTVEEDHKGKFPYRRLPVNLTGDDEGKKDDHGGKMVKRLAPKLPLMLFGNQRGKRLTVFGYTNGTWFQMIGQKAEGDDPIVWRFTHCEPYLRRTFAGTTEELRRIVSDGLAGKKQPPDANEKEPPGLGPEVPPEKSGRGQGGTLFAVIPTLGIGGPLAILAVLFPTVFGGVLVLFRSWMAFFTVLGINTTLYCVHDWFLSGLIDSWWSTAAALWFAMTAVTLLGTLWAWRRHVRSVSGAEPVPDPPARTEYVVLAMLSVACLGTVLFCLLFAPPPAAEPWWNLLLAFSFGIWAGMVYRVCRSLLGHSHPAPVLVAAQRPVAVERTLSPVLAVARSEQFAIRAQAARMPLGNGSPPPEQPDGARPVRSTMPTEAVILCVVLFASVAFGAARPGRRAVAADGEAGEGRTAAKLVPSGQWIKVFDGSGTIFSSPLVTQDHVYVASAARQGLETFGILYCVDLKTKKIVWKFDDDSDMKQVFCSPVLADGRVYVGEGFHEDKGCKLYCVDAKSGKKIWAFATGSHTESTPVVVGGRVYFGAGDDGVYCADAVKGTKIWQFPEGERAKKLKLHVDSTPAVAGKRVYVGGGFDEDDGHGDPALACLDAETGKEIWVRETPRWMVRRGGPAGEKLPVPAWGSPVVDGKQVFYGVGNGRMTESSKNFEPVGALLCVDAETGKDLWDFKVGDGVLNRPAIDRSRVYFGARDGYCYCVDRQTGKQRWKRSLGSAVVVTPALDRCDLCGHTSGVYVLGVEGQVCCLDPYTGKVHWSFDDLQQRDPVLASSPTVVVTHTPEGDRRRLYFGATLNNLAVQALYCLEDLAPER